MRIGRDEGYHYPGQGLRGKLGQHLQVGVATTQQNNVS
jgi:hypothetical protein